MAKVFQVQAKDSIVAIGPYPTVNAVQNLNLDPAFNEENLSELGNENFTDTVRTPETTGSFEVNATGSIPSVLARMIFDFDNQTYMYAPATQGNVYTIVQTDFENAIFDVINLKKPGEVFQEAQLVPYAQLTGLTIRVDATGNATESYTFEADRQEAYNTPYHDLIVVPLETATATSADINTTDFPGINSGTHSLVAVYQNEQKFDDTEAVWSDIDTITVATAAFETVAPFDRLTAVLYRKSPGAFPTIHNPTTARFMRGDRIDIWLVDSGTAVGSLTDATRLLRCQSADINVDLTRDRLQQILRNSDQSTTFFRGLNFPLEMQVTVNILETTLETWADLQGKTLNPSADPEAAVDANNVVNLADFIDRKLIIRYYPRTVDTAICTIEMDNIRVTSFSERQQVQGRAERSIGFVGSNITITGADG